MHSVKKKICKIIFTGKTNNVNTIVKKKIRNLSHGIKKHYLCKTVFLKHNVYYMLTNIFTRL